MKQDKTRKWRAQSASRSQFLSQYAQVFVVDVLNTTARSILEGSLL